jgi:hypothetical protein
MPDSQRARPRGTALAAASLCLLGLAACASAPRDLSNASIVDARGRFREMLCAVMQARAAPGSCSEALVHTEDELPARDMGVDLSPSRAGLTVLYVPGLWADCLGATALTVAQMGDYFARFGYDFTRVNVSGVASSRWNAQRIHAALLGMPEVGRTRRAVIVGYSKGIVDTLEALEAYPELRQRVTAVISLAGAVGGSPLADPPLIELLQLFSLVPGNQCREGDHGALNSLRRGTRYAWLSRHPLYGPVRYYSIVAAPEPDRVSSGLRLAYEVLNGIGGRNDGNVFIADQILPAGTLLGYVNADHFAAAIDLRRSPYASVRDAADRSDFPRAALLEAALRFVEENLNLGAMETVPGRDRLPVSSAGSPASD